MSIASRPSSGTRRIRPPAQHRFEGPDLIRTEIKDACDRYAKIEAANLLKWMEASRALAILTTNLKQNLDQGDNNTVAIRSCKDSMAPLREKFWP